MTSRRNRTPMREVEWDGLPQAARQTSGSGASVLSPRLFLNAFTLLEVMIAIAFIGFALLALLSLHHSSMQSVVRARELTQAAMLAQALMTDAEQSRFPDPGRLKGDFQKMYPGQYPNFRWERIVEQSHEFPDIRRVRVAVFYGPEFRRTFVLTEFMHNPFPQLNLPIGVPMQPSVPSQAGGDQQ
jgi:type II secretory pathway pseudopilin PulG